MHFSQLGLIKRKNVKNLITDPMVFRAVKSFKVGVGGCRLGMHACSVN